MMELRRIILMQQGVETLDFFSRQLGDAFQKRGLSVFYFDLTSGERDAKHLKKFQKSGETALITFNFEGLEREEGLFSPAEGYLWQAYRIPCFNICVDHPYWYENRFANLLEDEERHPGMLPLYHHVSIDRNHEKYLKDYYPEFQSAGFLPLAGSAFLPGESFPPVSERKTELLFTGHYTELPFFDASIHAINEEYAAFYMGIIEDLISHPSKTAEEVELQHVQRETGETDPKMLRLVFYKMLFVDLYVRNYYRGKAVQILADAGFPVTVIGKGWDKLPLRKKENLTILPRRDSAGCLKALLDAKVSLNVLPWFKDGAHDRVFSSILNGAVSLTDPSTYLLEELPEGIGTHYFSLENMDEELPRAAEELLSSPSLCRDIVSRGYTPVRSSHTWDTRADFLLRNLI